MKRYILIFAVGLMMPMFLNAQSLKKAKKQMDKYNYARAVTILKKATTDKKNRNKAIPMLAECYRLQRDIFNTKATYAQAVNLPDAKPESFFYYAQALQATGDYVKAREMFKKYAQKNPSDPRGELFAAHCDSVLGPWKKITPAIEVKIAKNINTYQSDFGASFYDGGLVFASDFSDEQGESKEYGWTGRGFLNIMKSRPLKKDDFWGSMTSPEDFGGKFNQPYHDGPATFSIDGSSIYFTRSDYGKAKRKGIYKTNLLKIYYASQTDGEWSDIKPFFLNSTSYSVGHPALSVDGDTLYFVSNMPGGFGGTDIWMCERQGNEWSQPLNLGPVINTAENEMFPSIRENGVMYFSSEGHPGYGALDIFITSRVNGEWTTPVNLHPPINGSFDDFALAYAPGADNGFFSSNRPGGVGSDDIYAFRAKDITILPTLITGVVRDNTTMKPIADATVFILNPTTGKVKILKTTADGKYETKVENPGDFIVKAMQSNFIADCIPFSLAALQPGTTVSAPRDLFLDKLVLDKTFRVENIYYDFDRFNIRKDARPELDRLVRIMKENAIDVELGSHTDSRGTLAYNDRLSQRRAEAAVVYIIEAGIDNNRITAKGYGERMLTNHCVDGVKCSPEEHQANRRTEFRVTSVETAQPTSQYALSNFNEGDEISVFMFEREFFNSCLLENINENNTGYARKTASGRDATEQSAISPDDMEEPTDLSWINSNIDVYKVQLFALSRKISLTSPDFQGLRDIQMYADNNMFKYTSGSFKTHAQALDYRSKLVKMGFADAFVVVYSNGKLRLVSDKK